MAQRGQASTAHEFDDRDVCIHCDMYKVNVEKMNHVCKPHRELAVDQAEADARGVSLLEYRLAGQMDELPTGKKKRG